MATGLATLAMGLASLAMRLATLAMSTAASTATIVYYSVRWTR